MFTFKSNDYIQCKLLSKEVVEYAIDMMYKQVKNKINEHDSEGIESLDDNFDILVFTKFTYETEYTIFFSSMECLWSRDVTLKILADYIKSTK